MAVCTYVVDVRRRGSDDVSELDLVLTRQQAKALQDQLHAFLRTPRG